MAFIAGQASLSDVAGPRILFAAPAHSPAVAFGGSIKSVVVEQERLYPQAIG